ncbi:MAG: hypothetical protein KAH15_06240 [Candidatus Marinimicrobia bacterium]|nr:hypothetical protein [Candidatus Neomarinimicrobiota bacterium]
MAETCKDLFVYKLQKKRCHPERSEKTYQLGSPKVKCGLVEEVENYSNSILSFEYFCDKLFLLYSKVKSDASRKVILV